MNRFIILEKASRPVTPVLQPQPVSSNVGPEIRPKARGFQLSLERYNRKPKSDLTTWIAQLRKNVRFKTLLKKKLENGLKST